MSNKFYFAAIVLLSLLTSCSSFESSGSSAAQEEVVFDDAHKPSTDNEIIIDDKTFQSKEITTADRRQSSPAVTQTAKDGSQISVMYDNFGNKTETRTFNNTVLKFVILRTSADGSRQTFVYGQNGDVKSLPENMLDKVMTAPLNELASSAGIYEPVRETRSFAQNTLSLNNTALTPLPSSQFPIPEPTR
jgi:major membrane immunogen (membrane-anchored lipoprotein)